MKHTVFLSYASEDRLLVQRVYRTLRQARLAPWMDKPPRPWQHEGLRPGEEWDQGIRGRLARARVILIFLSRRSIQKKGYVQREYRLALNMAMEQPPGSTTVIPVLLQPCQVPDIRVDTVSLRGFQWYELYASGAAALVDHLLALLRPSGAATLATAPRGTRKRQGTEAQTLLEIASCLHITKSQGTVQPANAPRVLRDAIACVSNHDLPGLRNALTAMDAGYPEVDARRATVALQDLADPFAATAVAVLLGHRLRYTLSESGRYLRRWLDHPVPEVGAVAALLLTRQQRASAPALDFLSHYCRREDRLEGSHAILRDFLSYDHLLRLARRAHEMLWELLANDHHFGGMGQSHIPMRNAGDKFRFLTDHECWKAREVGAAIFCADRDIACGTKVHLLSDPEPRVRFRALEGVLLSLETAPLDFIIDLLLENGDQQRETRSWQVKRVSGSPPFVTVVLKDRTAPRPRFATGGFGRGASWDFYESINDRPHSLVGFGMVSASDDQVGHTVNDDRYKSRTAKLRPKWTHKYVH